MDSTSLGDLDMALQRLVGRRDVLEDDLEDRLEDRLGEAKWEGIESRLETFEEDMEARMEQHERLYEQLEDGWEHHFDGPALNDAAMEKIEAEAREKLNGWREEYRRELSKLESEMKQLARDLNR